MSFITKRERVFNEYDLFELPSRNEGKLKAYSSCTDARAWSHFCSDKTEHLVEIIKRNNETCRPKYVPTDVIVDTIMIAKNAEIARLRRRIEEFEQMLAAYDQLDLSCDQKCEIANAHASIKAANRELDELCLNLDLSGFTEGVDSEGFQTGKSSGDEWPAKRRESKCNQVELLCPCDASTSAHDVRIDEMQEAIISKDAKLSAMQNTIAVMENDVCEPYCIYAHIYTALEKIFGILCQNDKYRLYLDLLSAGKDTRCIDIKGRILYKLKVLEKFSMALIAPCSQENEKSSHTDENCACYHAEVITHVETTFALTSAETNVPAIDNRRAKLVADIMEHDEMREILGKEYVSGKFDNDRINDDLFGIEDYNIETENLHRLKSLQLNYDELMTCYENMKHERDCLKLRCDKYEELEKEFISLQNKLREYNGLWNEKEHYRKRSEDLDSLKEQYLVLSEETSNLETQLKAEAEINNIKSGTVDDLRAENILLEKKLNDASIAFEKEKNALQCKLKETECQVMCQEQQIKSLSTQIDRLLEHDHNKKEDVTNSIQLIDEMESLRDQIKNLKEALYGSEEEKQQIQDQFEDKLKTINDLRMEIEDWKSTYEKTFHRNDCLEKCTENFRDEVHRLMDENKNLSLEIEEKSTAVGNLINVINNKSQEINNLMDQIEQKRRENRDLLKQLREFRVSYDKDITSLENEKKQAFNCLQLARQESQELLEKVKDYDDVVHKKDDMSRYLQAQQVDCEELKNILQNTLEDNKRLQMDLESRENNNTILLQEIHRLREVNNNAADNINNLQDEKNQYRTSLELTRKESEILEGKLLQFEDLREQLNNLRKSHDKLMLEKSKLEDQLRDKSDELDNAVHSIQLTKKESEQLVLKLEQSENIKEDFAKLSNAYQNLTKEKQALQNQLIQKNNDVDNLLQTLNKLKKENEELLNKCKHVATLEQELAESKRMYEELMSDFDNKTEEINNLCNNLESKIEENRHLFEQIKTMKQTEVVVNDNIAALQREHSTTQLALDAVKKESEALINKLKNYETLANEFDKLKRAHDQMKLEKDRLDKEYHNQLANLKRLEKENTELNGQSQNLLTHNEDLEKALISARNQLMSASADKAPYADIMKEIEAMKKEKLINHQKIRDLLDKLEESENIISNLSEDVLARDDKIAILENHINALKDEVKRLHNNLAAVVDTGEQMQESYHKIDQSLYKMEAHHSKATHNMKMEVAKLQNEKAKLEQQLSVNKQKSDESFRDRHKYMSQVIHYQNEREIIVTDIKQLELSAVGDSSLTPDNCSTEDILYSLDRLRRSLQARNSKSTTLEQTLLKVQTSSQLLLSKADEAKKLVEKEKQKIINEKEEAIADRLNIEKQLMDLKKQLEEQTRHDKGVIKDLEAEILNQRLIIDQINKSTQNYISKLEDDMKTLQELYKNSLAKVNDLQDKVKYLTDEKNKSADIIEKINDHLSEKSKEVASLLKNLNELKNKELMNIGVQAGMPSTKKNTLSQTDNSQIGNYPHTIQNMEPRFLENNKDVTEQTENINILKIKKPQHENPVIPLLPKHKPQSVNEVQVLTANVEPTFDFVKNSYQHYKLKRLGPGRLEQYSIACLVENVDSNNMNNVISESVSDTGKTYEQPQPQNPRIVDIYNRQSMHTNSSKVGNVDIDDSIHADRDPQSATKSSAFTGFDLTNDLFESQSNVNDNKYDSNAFIGSTSGKSTDKDLFVIYRDSETSDIDKVFDDKEFWQVTNQPEILVEAMATQVNKAGKKYDKNLSKLNQQKAFIVQEELFHEAEDHSAKPKLKIELPRVEVGTPSAATTSDGDVGGKKSSQQNKDKIRNKDLLADQAQDAKKDVKEKNLDGKYSHSHHKLSRVDANFLLIKNKNNLNQANVNDPGKIEEPGNFGLEYILNSVRREIDPDADRAYESLRASRSDVVFSQSRELGFSEINPSKLSHLISSTEYKTLSSFNPSSDKSQPKSVTEQLIKTETADEYERRIQYLTRALDNMEKDYKRKMESIKIQYDSNIKSIINEHNQGVRSIQNLHEETLQDILKIHENEVENLRSMSIEAMRKAEKLEKENRLLKTKFQGTCTCLDEEPVKISTPELKKPKSKCRGDTKLLTKTNVEAFNVKPKLRSHGPCTCSLDVNISDTIRNIFQQVDVEQRKMAEYTYLKYIANKIMNGNFEALDAQELSFLHLKVCRTWKTKLSKEEALQKRIDSLETELMNKQRHAQQHIAELDRKVAEERRRLQEVREAVCRNSPIESRMGSPDKNPAYESSSSASPASPPSPTIPDMDFVCNCNSGGGGTEIGERRSAGDLLPGRSGICTRMKRVRPEGSRGVLTKLDIEERRDKKLYNDEPPTRLRRAHDRPPLRPHKK